MLPSNPSVENHQRAPSAFTFIARALLPSSGVLESGDLPTLVERWHALRIDRAHLAAFRQATGNPGEATISILYPHVLGFRLQMALLTRSRFPLPIWSALQIRNRLVCHRQIDPDAVFELETRNGACRRVEKGLEVDLHSRLGQGDECVWESVVTYFYRGRLSPAPAASQAPSAPELAASDALERFRMPTGGGWRFGTLTGDYNGLHWSDWYARRFGFRAASLHPQRAAGICLAKLRGPSSTAQSLDLWIKGPMFYGAAVTLHADLSGDALRFGLSLASDPRMALLGTWTAAARS